MFPFLRFSAVTASIIVASTALGFGLATMLSAHEADRVELSNGPSVASPNAQTRENTETRSIAGYRSIALDFRSLDMGNMPAINPQGPMPSVEHVNMGPTRELVSACLMAAN